PRGATSRTSGGAATTSTTGRRRRGDRGRAGGRGIRTHGLRPSFPAGLPRRLGADLRRQYIGDDRLVRRDAGDGGDADARRLDDVDGVDADAGPDVARRRRVLPPHVDRDDGGDDAAIAGPDAVALPPGRRQQRGDAPGPADGARGRGVLLRVDRVRNG